MSGMPEKTKTILDAWYSQNPTFALMGEFSAGKSTLLNLLLGGTFLPTQVTATNMPVIWLTYAEKQSAFALSHDGDLTEFDLNDLGAEGKKGHLLMRLALPIEVLKYTDIIDTPGISDPRLAVGALNFLGPYLDFAVWCSAANQAWRQTEKAMWTSLPESLRSNSILALTRSDTLKKDTDLKKVVSRCQREAGDLFREFTPIATVAALSAKAEDGEITDQDVWEKSHAAAFFESLDTSIAVAQKSCEARETIASADQEKPAVKPAKKATTPAKRKAAAKPTAKTTATKAKPREKAKAKTKTTVENANVSSLLDSVSKLRQSKVNTSSKDQFSDTLKHLFNTFLGETHLSEAHQMVLTQMMSLERSDDVSHDGVLVQLERELNDFADTAWCKLDQTN